MLEPITTALFTAVLLTAAWTDLATRRVPNALTLPAIAAALALRLPLGADAAVAGLLGVGLALAICLPFFAAGAMGGGDAKLLMAVGAFLGPRELVTALLLTAVAGGVMGLVSAARARILGLVLVDTLGLMRYWMSFGQLGPKPSPSLDVPLKVPYAVAIAIGSLAGRFVW